MGGDINLIWNIEEKLGGKYIGDLSRPALEDNTAQHKLLDFPPSNRKLTWSNKRTEIHNIKERLDRFFIQEDIKTIFSSIKSKIVHASALDHKLVVLILDKWENQGPIAFKCRKILGQQGKLYEYNKRKMGRRDVGLPTVCMGNQAQKCERKT